MPHRTPKYGNPQHRKFQLGVKTSTAAKYRKVDTTEDEKLVKERDLVVPKTIAGMLTQKRYTQLRKMGIQMGDIGALCQLADDGDFPGELLFSGKKKQLLDKKYKKLRIAMRHKLNARWIEMRDERVSELKKAAKKLDKRNKAKRKKEDAAKAKKLKVRAKKRSALNVSGQPKVKKPKIVPTSYTDGNLPEQNSPHA